MFRRLAASIMPLFLLLQLFRLACFILFTIFIVDCMLEEQQTSVDCKNFTIYNDPYLWKTNWLSCSVLTSFIILFALCKRFVPEMRPQKNLKIIKVLLKKPFFWSYSSLITLVIAYDVLIIYNNKDCKVHIEVLVIISKIFTMFLVFQLNFTHPPSTRLGFQMLTIFCYYFSLFLYVLDNTCKAITTAAQVAFKVYTVHKGSNVDPIVIVDLMLMATSAALYNYFLQFFWNKIFFGGKDILTVCRQDFTLTLEDAH